MQKPGQSILQFIKRADMVLLILCSISTIFGIVVIASATATYNSNSYVLIQTAAFLLGLGIFVLFTVIDIDIIADRWAILFIFDVLFILALIPFGVGGDETGNQAWLRFMGIGIQPAEVVKVVYIIIMAKHISYLKQYRNLSSVFSMSQLVVHFMFMFALIVGVSKDLGSALVYLFIFILMIFAAGVKLYWFAIGIASIAAATPFLWTNFLTDNHKNRILAPYVSTIDPSGTGVNWQTTRSKLALASGQAQGTGLYNGTQTQSDALPAKHNDFIFSVIGEELGMIGCTIVIILLVAIIIRCVYIGLKSRNTMNMLVCCGVAAMLTAQTFENIGMCIGIAPVIGVTLPFFSYGGSSTVALFAAMGIVSGIRFRPKPERFRSYG